MKISEKTAELNICSQISAHSKRHVLWFGLTQMQEAIAGFDAATRCDGDVFLFQFKSSDTTTKTGARRFLLEHRQLEHLYARTGRARRKVFYVLPMIGNTKELHQYKENFLTHTWLLDIARLPVMPNPVDLKKKRSQSKSFHTADVFVTGSSAVAVLKSKPVEVKLIRLADAVKSGFVAHFPGEFPGLILHERNTEISGIEHLLDPGLKMAILHGRRTEK